MPQSLKTMLNPRRSLRMRFALLLGGSGLAFALLAALLVDRYQREQLAQSQGQALRREAQLISRSLDVALQDRLRQLGDTAAQPLLSSGLIEPGDLRLLLEALRTQQPAFAWLAVTDSRGRVQVATNGLQEGQSVANERWFVEAQRAPWIGSRRPAPALAPLLGLPGGATPVLIDLAVPLTDLQGRNLGVLVAYLRWDWLEQLHRGLNDTGSAPGIGTESVVLDRDGRVLLGPQAWLDEAPPVDGLAGLGPNEAARVLRWSTQHDYLTALGRYDATPGQPTAALTVLVRLAAEQAFRDADALRRHLLLIGLLGTLVYVALSVWVANRVARPIQALSAAAARVGRGEAPQFDAMPPRRNDEVADLARTLQALHVELSHRLAEQARATERFEALFRAAPVAIYLTADRQLQMANDACLQLFGAPDVAALRGKTSLELFHPDDRPMLQQRIVMLDAWRRGDPAMPILSHRIVRLDGSVAEVESTAMPINDTAAQGVQVVLRDVTEERRAQALLREREAQLAQTNRMAQVGGWSLDLQTGRSSWTDEIARIYELPVARVPTGREAVSYFVPPYRAQLEQAIRKLMTAQQPYDLVLQLRAATGTLKWVRAQARAVVHDGKVVGLEGFTQDISERRAAEEAVRELNAQLENRVAERTAALQAANAELDSFAYAVSHDLRAPLRAMSGFSQALTEDYGPELDAGARGYIEQIVQGAQRMGALIDGLLALSRSVRGELRVETVDLSGMATRAIADLCRAEPGRQVQARIQPGLLAMADPRMLDAVVNNLVSNAWKYSSHQAATHIDFHAEDIDGVRWFCLTDNGAGFDMAHAGRLFKAFSRLHRQDEFPGIGIGLATVQRVIHRHGGRITAVSSPGQGATFRFTLPAPKAGDRTESATP